MLVSGPLSQEAASLTSMVTSSTLPYDVHFEAMLSHSWVICARSVLGVPSCRCDDASKKAGVSYNPVVFMCQLTKTTIFPDNVTSTSRRRRPRFSKSLVFAPLVTIRVLVAAMASSATARWRNAIQEHQIFHG